MDGLFAHFLASINFNIHFYSDRSWSCQCLPACPVSRKHFRNVDRIFMKLGIRQFYYNMSVQISFIRNAAIVTDVSHEDLRASRDNLFF
jgi:hypothetical protein